VFITECEFDNNDIEGTSSIEWRHVSGVRTHRSVIWCLNSLNHRSRNCMQKTAVLWPLFTVTRP
jgi:hypothetical protein